MHYGLFTLTEMDSDSDSELDGYIVLCRTFHIAQTRTQTPTPYFCTGQESEFQSVSGNVNEPFLRPTRTQIVINSIQPILVGLCIGLFVG